MSAIVDIHAREILDSRGNPTVEVDVRLETGAFGRAAAPSGASTGSHEAHERRDGGERYHGRGVQNAVAAVNGEIFDLLSGLDADRQIDLDRKMLELDGSANKSRLGANGILAVSLALAQAAAADAGLPLYRYIGGLAAHTMPTPLMNILNGGAHADNRLDIQEFMIMPRGAPDMATAVRCGAEVFHALKAALRRDGHNTNVGDEGGFAPDFSSAEQALDAIMGAIEAAGYTPGSDVALALDCAAGEYYRDGRYRLQGMDKDMDGAGHAAWLRGLVDAYPIISIEDGMDEDDWEGWGLLNTEIGGRCQLVGDDLFATNPARLARGIAEGSANAILVKPNQIGSLSETLAVIEQAKRAAFGIVVSHRSGETEDSSIADLAVATNCGQIKIGSLSRSDRLAKYNRLLRIAEELGTAARYAGGTAIAGVSTDSR